MLQKASSFCLPLQLKTTVKESSPSLFFKVMLRSFWNNMKNLPNQDNFASHLTRCFFPIVRPRLHDILQSHLSCHMWEFKQYQKYIHFWVNARQESHNKNQLYVSKRKEIILYIQRSPLLPMFEDFSSWAQTWYVL